MQFSIKTGSRTQMVDITAQVRDIVRQSGINNGLVHVFPCIPQGCDHNEMRTGSACGYLSCINKVIPLMTTSHIWKEFSATSSQPVRPSEPLPLKWNLVLGTWQSLFFCEFDGPRTRKVNVTIVGQ